MEAGGLCVPRVTADPGLWSKAKVLGPLSEEWTQRPGAELTILGSTAEEMSPVGAEDPCLVFNKPQGFSSVLMGEGAGPPPTAQAGFWEGLDVPGSRTPGPRALKGGLCTQNKSASMWKWEQRSPRTGAAQPHSLRKGPDAGLPQQAAGTAFLGPWLSSPCPASPWWSTLVTP